MSIKQVQVLYRAQATAHGGRDGYAQADNNAFKLPLSVPKEMGGQGGPGTNPEQLFAAGYSACFLSALKLVAKRENFPVPADASITGIVGIGRIPNDAFGLEVELRISLPGVDPNKANGLIAQAHQVCPYSNATRGNITVTLTLVSKDA